MVPETISPTKGVKDDDIIVAFMGPTGSGKSFVSSSNKKMEVEAHTTVPKFIDLLTGQSGKRSGNSLESVTKEIGATRMPLPGDPKEREIVLVDTPGFDGTTTSDMEVLTMINKWLEKTYERNIKLSGLIYLHRITDNRMGGNPCKNVRMFSELCGELAMTQVVLVTTMWQRMALGTGEMRERELINEYWKALINKGSSVDRLGKATYEDAWAIVWAMLERKLKKEASELVLLYEKRAIDEPLIGKTSYTDLHKQLVKKEESMDILLAEVENISDPRLKRELRKECQRIQREIEQTRLEAEELKQSIFTKVFSFLYTLLAGKPKRRGSR